MLFRYIKGLFNAEYKAEQAKLDRMEALRDNASFNRLMRHHIVKVSTGAEDPNAGESTNESRILSSRLKKMFKQAQSPVTMQDIKTLTRGSNKVGAVVRDLAECAMNTSYVGPCITVKGEVLTPLEFIKRRRKTTSFRDIRRHTNQVFFVVLCIVR